MRRVLLDSNALDPLLTQVGAYEVLDQAVRSEKLAVFFTHVTIDEVAATPDLAKRQWLLNLLVFLGRPIATSVMVLDYSRLDFCRLIADDDTASEPLRSGNIKHSRDALIAHTALHEGFTLITNEKRLTARAREQCVEVLTTVELLTEFRAAYPDAVTWSYSEQTEHGCSGLCSGRRRSAAANNANQRALKSQVRRHTRR
jgi:predicted nucleic acid-binding protein